FLRGTGAMDFRVGFPTTTTFRARLGERPLVSEKWTKILSAIHPRILFVKPMTAFCSMMKIGIERSFPTRSVGPQTYPPAPTTSDGRLLRNNLKMEMKLLIFNKIFLKS